MTISFLSASGRVPEIGLLRGSVPARVRTASHVNCCWCNRPPLRRKAAIWQGVIGTLEEHRSSDEPQGHLSKTGDSDDAQFNSRPAHLVAISLAKRNLRTRPIVPASWNPQIAEQASGTLAIVQVQPPSRRTADPLLLHRDQPLKDIRHPLHAAVHLGGGHHRLPQVACINHARDK